MRKKKKNIKFETRKGGLGMTSSINQHMALVEEKKGAAEKKRKGTKDMEW